MFSDISDIETGAINGDICLVGAGAAGISLAKQFLNSPHKVILLEAGGLEYEESTQALYRGESEGLMYFPLASARLRYFGGSTGHWGGACTPLDAIDFEKRGWLPHSGWPFQRTELEPYYPMAQKICGIGPFDYRTEYWSDPETSPALPLADTGIQSRIIQNSNPPLRFGTAYRTDLEDAENIQVVLHANVLEFVADTENENITGVNARNIDGRRLHVKARIYVLCAGGLENPRLMLLSNKQYPQGIGNHNNLVGRYFMEHIYVSDAGKLMLSEPRNMKLYERHNVNGTDIRTGLCLSQDAQRSDKLMNAWVGFKLKGAPSSQRRYSSLNYLKRSIRNGEIPEDLWRHIGAVIDDLGDHIKRKFTDDKPKKRKDKTIIGFSTHSEQAPNPESRVHLGEDIDEFGQRTLVLDWRLTDIDHASVRKTLELMAHGFGMADLGRIMTEFSGNDDGWATQDSTQGNTTPSGSFHQMGTTRMHSSAKEGVVDSNLKVHGLNNMYVAGSSVFPTCGWSNPTLTIVALSCRLADHLKLTLS